jgi:hypothetical protein
MTDEPARHITVAFTPGQLLLIAIAAFVLLRVLRRMRRSP